jgi:thiol-disulfide isomerase/thioredoxin
MHKAINSAALLAGAFLLVAAAPEKTQRLNESGDTKVGNQAPPFGAFDLAGRNVLALAALLKTPAPAPLLVTFGASWCVPCNEGLPRLVELEKKHKGAFRLVLVDVEPDAQAAQGFAAKCGMTGPALLDKFEVIAKSYGLHETHGEKSVLVFPRTFLLTAKGRVAAIYREEGKDLEEVIEADLKQILAAGDAPPAPPQAPPTQAPAGGAGK